MPAAADRTKGARRVAGIDITYDMLTLLLNALATGQRVRLSGLPSGVRVVGIYEHSERVSVRVEAEDLKEVLARGVVPWLDVQIEIGEESQ